MNFVPIIKSGVTKLGNSSCQMWSPDTNGIMSSIWLGFLALSSNETKCVIPGSIQDTVKINEDIPRHNDMSREMCNQIAANMLSGMNISRGKFGNPIFPDGWIGSLSHSNSCACVIALNDKTGTIGVDVQCVRDPLKIDWRSRILTPRELQDSESKFIDNLRMMDATVRFSVKESFFKAVSQIQNHRYIGFKEIEVFPCYGPVNDGSCIINLCDSRLKVLEGRIKANYLVFQSPIDSMLYAMSCVQTQQNE